VRNGRTGGAEGVRCPALLDGRRATPLTKKEIAKAIAEDVGVSGAMALEIVQRVFDGIIEVLVSEGRIELRNFGVFVVRKRRARQARNPKTGERVSVPERQVVAFKAGLEMEGKVQKIKAVPDRA
jgi:integration host factor subunit beta